MSVKQDLNEGHTHLPTEFTDRFRAPFQRFLAMETAGGVALLISTTVAILISNSSLAGSYHGIWESYFGVTVSSIEYGRTLREWINDGLMTFFFFLVALELKRELVLGELKNPRMAALSVAAAGGGMMIPAALYLVLQWDRMGLSGWGTVMATDTAFVLGALALLGPRIPQALRVFMLSLAIVDDVGAILVVAIGYNEGLAWPGLALAACGFILIYLLARAGVRSIAIYGVAGVLVWAAIDASGIHATVTGVILGLMTPARRWVSDERLYAILGQVVAHPAATEGTNKTLDRESLQIAEVAARETLSPVERLEIALHGWVSFLVMPIFALANAGLRITTGVDDLFTSFAVLCGFVFGKPLGVLGFCWIALRFGIALRPEGLTWPLMAGGGLLAGTGFTMALFIAGLAFDTSLLDSAKLGIYGGSLLSIVLGVAVLAWVTRPVLEH